MEQVHPNLPVPMGAIEAFCGKWKVAELELFGSVLRDDFGPESDVDVLVTFADGFRADALGLVRRRDELREMFGRRVGLVERRLVEASDKTYRRNGILTHRRSIYAA